MKRPICDYPYCENTVKQKKKKNGQIVFTNYCSKHLKADAGYFVS